MHRKLALRQFLRSAAISTSAAAMALVLTAFVRVAEAAPVILNEYNAVDDELFLEQADASDVFWGRREGNGNDWFELAVVTDHLDMRGWQIEVTNETGNPAQESFLLELSANDLWSDLRSGTIITFSEELANNAADYRPEVGRWWINVRAHPETNGTYVTVYCLAPGCSPGAANWKVSNNNWQVRIKDFLGATMFGPAGEGINPPSGVGSDEVCKLEQNPSASITPLSAYNDGTSSTFGQPNTFSGGAMQQSFATLRSVVPYSPLTSVRINEVASHTDPGLDWIELRNMTASPVNIGGWFLSDSFDQLDEHEIPAGTIVPAFGHVVFDQADLGFGLSGPCGDELILSQGNGTAPTGPRDFVEFGAIESNVTFGRSPDGTGPLVRLIDDTPGSLNAPSLEGPVVINEVMYHPLDPTPPSTLDAEFVELRNLTNAPVTLATNFGPSGTHPWRLTGGVDFAFSASHTIAAQGFLLVVNFDPVALPARLAEFRSFYGVPMSVPVVGPYTGKLGNFTDTVRLRRPDTPEPDGEICGDIGNPGPYVPQVVIDELTYFDFGAWPAAADGAGASLERIDVDAFGDDSTNWAPNLFTFATPGMHNSTFGAATAAQQKCANGLNKGFATVLKSQGSDAGSCMKSGSGGRLAPITIEDCIAGDFRGKVAKAAGTTNKAFQASCTGFDGAEPKLGFFGPSSSAIVNAAAVTHATAMLHDVFGDDLDAAIALSDTEPALAKCQLAVAKAVKACGDERAKAFNACKKLRMKSAIVEEGRELAACVGDDPLGKVGGACDPSIGKLRTSIDKNCVAVGVALTDALPGCNSASAQGAAECAASAAACRSCLALSAADNVAPDCDLADDGTDDDSCP